MLSPAPATKLVHCPSRRVRTSIRRSACETSTYSSMEGRPCTRRTCHRDRSARSPRRAPQRRARVDDRVAHALTVLVVNGSRDERSTHEARIRVRAMLGGLDEDRSVRREALAPSARSGVRTKPVTRFVSRPCSGLPRLMSYRTPSTHSCRSSLAASARRNSSYGTRCRGAAVIVSTYHPRRSLDAPRFRTLRNDVRHSPPEFVESTNFHGWSAAPV